MVRLGTKNDRHIFLLATISILLTVLLINVASSTNSKYSTGVETKTVHIKLAEKVAIKTTGKAPVMTNGKLKEIKDVTNKIGKYSGSQIFHIADSVGPSGIPQTEVRSLQSIPSDLTFFRKTKIGSIIPNGYNSVINEPTVMANGKLAFMTGNWYAARSNDSGKTFSYIDPYADFPGFCCDQDTIYDPTRDMFIWYRMGVPNDGRFRLGVSDDTVNWNMYDLFPSDVDIDLANSWWDYPHMALSNNYLYIATNAFNKDPSPSNWYWTGTVMFKLNLDDIKSGNGIVGFYYYTNDNFNLLPVQGAGETLYFASHNDNTNMRIFS